MLAWVLPKMGKKSKVIIIQGKHMANPLGLSNGNLWQILIFRDQYWTWVTEYLYSSVFIYSNGMQFMVINQFTSKERIMQLFKLYSPLGIQHVKYYEYIFL